jgi:RNA polymerase sigma-70 factor (ECF subfamily)
MAAGSPSKGAVDPDRWVRSHGDALYRYALLRLGDADRAEDVVQETLLAALRAKKRFAGQSSERTWLVGILRHKIADRLRQHFRDKPSSACGEEKEDSETFFRRDGVWLEKPRRWSGLPEDVLEEQEFWEVLRGCLAGLPPRLAEAFTLRELDDLDSPKTCDVLGVSATNLWTLLHRARLRLRKCLEIRWFGEKRRRN